MKHTVKSSLALAISAALAGCGGGGAATTPAAVNPPPAGSTTRAVQTTGPVTNFGSVVVNGVRYNTDRATFAIDGQPGMQASLRVGHIVTVKGRVNDDGANGEADDVYYDDIVTGAVEAIDVAGGTLVVLGQTVIVTPTTSFDDDFEPDGLSAIAVGQFVEVSGMFDADGNIVASRIDDEDDSDYEVHGFVAGLDRAASTFSLGSLLVDYSGAMLDDFPGGLISDGDYVEAKGDALGANGELIADEIEYESILEGHDDDDADDDDDLYEIEGYITRFESPADFDVAGQAVRAVASTDYEDGTADDLALNVKVDVEGTLDTDGVLVAEEIEFERERDNDVRIVAAVDAVDAGNNMLTLLGIDVALDAETRMEDKSDDDDSERLDIADIAVGDVLEIRGEETAEGGVNAARLEREDEDETELQGFVTTISEPGFVILGVTIETDGDTDFEGPDDDDLSASEFFSILTAGALIKVQGEEVSDTTIVAREVEFETDD